MKTLHPITVIILIVMFVVVSQNVFAKQTAEEILQERDNAKKTGLSYNGTILMVTQTIDKTEYKTGEKFSVTPYLQNVGNNVATIMHGEPLFMIKILDQDNNTAFIWGDNIATIGITESLEPWMSTTGKWTSGYGGFPNISLDKTGNYTVYSVASINSEGTPVHMESIWSRPLNIVVFPANSTSQINNTMLEENTIISKQPSHVEVIISPLQQFQSGIAAKDVKCKEGLQFTMKKENGQFACVKMETANELFNRGWGIYPVSIPIFSDGTITKSSGITALKNQTSVHLTSHKIPSIFPGEQILSSCGGGAVQYHSSSNILNSTGFSVYHNVMNYSYVNNDDYVIQPGYQGTITYVIDAGASPISQLSYPLQKELNVINYAIFHHRITDYEELLHNPSVTISGGDYKSCFKRPDGSCAGMSGPITGPIDATVVDHPGVSTSFEPAAEILQYNDTSKGKSSQIITMTISVDNDAPQGTYWIILSPEECLGGEIFLLTVGDKPYHG